MFSSYFLYLYDYHIIKTTLFSNKRRLYFFYYTNDQKYTVKYSKNRKNPSDVNDNAFFHELAGVARRLSFVFLEVAVEAAYAVVTRFF